MADFFSPLRRAAEPTLAGRRPEPVLTGSTGLTPTQDEVNAIITPPSQAFERGLRSTGTGFSLKSSAPPCLPQDARCHLPM